MKFIIYDCEIIRCIPLKNGGVSSPFQYCQGWQDHKNMGISVIGCYLQGLTCFPDGMYSFTNPKSDIPFLFVNFQEILSEKPLVIGFNSLKFDDILLKSNNIAINTNYDLLEEIRIASYGSSKWIAQPKGWTYSLNAIAKANGMAKNGNGSLAPQFWQQGKQQMVIDYCLNDVRLTSDLLELGQKGKLIDPNTKQHLRLRPLESVREQ